MIKLHLSLQGLVEHPFKFIGVALSQWQLLVASDAPVSFEAVCGYRRGIVCTWGPDIYLAVVKYSI